MRWLLLVVLLAGGGPSPGRPQAPSDSDAASKIVALENVWNQAAEVKDLKALDTILDAAFVNVGSDGKLLTKSGVLADVNASHGVHVVSESMVVRSHGDTAVVTGIYVTKGTDRGKPFVRRDRFVDTWLQKSGAWVCIASLTTPSAS